MMDNIKVVTSNGPPPPYEKNGYKRMAEEQYSGPIQLEANMGEYSGPIQWEANMGPPTSVYNFVSAPMYRMIHRSGAKILMNTPKIVEATNMHFIPPATLQTKKNLCANLLNMKPMTATPQSDFDCTTFKLIEQKIQKYQSYDENSTNSSNSTANYNPKSFNSSKNSNSFSNSSNSKSSTTCNANASDSPRLEQHQTEGKTIVNAIKRMFSYIFKPIIDTTTMIVGSNNTMTTTAPAATKSAPEPMSGDELFWNGSPINMKNHSIHTMSTYCSDNLSSDRFSYSETYIHARPEAFFDCDDFVDEDIVDFVADSTKIENRGGLDHFATEFDLDKENFFDCVSKSELNELPANEISIDSHICHEEETIPSDDSETSDDNKSDAIARKFIDEMCKTDNVQYKNDINTPINCPKYDNKPNRNTYRRKRRGKRKTKSGNRRKGGSGPNKNRHEKIRHEVEMNIHDDIQTCAVVENGDESFAYEADDDIEPEHDLEIIDLSSPKMYATPQSGSPIVSYTPQSGPSCVLKAALSSPSIDSKIASETPIPSPEVIPKACIFTRFFRLDRKNCNQKQHMLPLRFMQRLVPHVRPVKDCRPVPVRAIETESDDSFIVFEECSPRRTAIGGDELMAKYATTTPPTPPLKDTCKRQRQLSECSDDFILFEEEATDDCAYRRYDTTDEDFTDSTDDSDSSDDESSCDESDSSELLPTSKRKDDERDSNQPDSGFEEKKVTFNLCPTVHEIRAWKFAYSQARKGKWEQMGRDRERFEKRINSLSSILTPILDAQHRQKIYHQRFCDTDHDQNTYHINEHS